MNKLTVENKEIDIEKQLAEYRELAGKRKLLEERVQRTEAEKESVKSHIFEKVCNEYKEALDTLAEEIKPVEQAVEKTRQAVLDEIKDIEDQMGDLQDQLDELTFRFRVGEFDQTERDKKENPLKKQLDEFKTQTEDLHSTIKKLSFEDDSPEEPAVDILITDMDDIKPSFEEKADSYAQPMDTFDIPMAADDNPQEQAAQSEFVVDPFAAPDADAEDDDRIIDESHVPDGSEIAVDEQDLVDPSKWVGEFVSEALGEMPSEKDAATPSPNTAAGTDTVTDTDPLASLADPSEDADAGKNTDPGASTPQQDVVDEPRGFPVLIITKGAGEGKKLPLLPMTMTLGREHDNNIELKDTDVSRYHARISFERGEYVIEDLEGSSGTWVNDKKIDRTPLSPGDTIRAGGTEMTIDLE